MKRLIAAILAAFLLSPAIATSQAPGQVITAFKPTATGAQVEVSGSSRLALDIEGTVGGAGAASLTVKPVKGGKLAKGKIFDDRGSLTVRFIFKRTASAADGTETYMGTGAVLTGAGAYTKARGQFTVVGTRSAARIYTLRFDGKVEYGKLTPLGSGRAR